MARRMKMYFGVDMPATGANIRRLRRDRSLSVRDIQEAMGFDCPSAIYKWEQGRTLPSIEHLMALSVLFDTRIEDILVWNRSPTTYEAQKSPVNGPCVH